MKLKLQAFAAIVVLWGSCGTWALAQIPAFSGAEGPGSVATGGRGGDVYHVTNLDSDKNGVVPGSLQYGINGAPASGRTIVFDVGGTIFLGGLTANDTLRYGKGNITIAGQTAPGTGITIAGTGTKWTGDNVILRNIAIRPNTNANGTTYDAFSLQLKNSIVDHVAATWFTDEGISETDSGHTTTVQYSLINEGLNYAGHSYGSIISTEVDGAQLSFSHNLYAHNNSRMPRLGSELAITATGAKTNFNNNVVYNWPSRAGYSGTDQPSSTNFLGNYYIRGNNNGSTVFLGGDSATNPNVTKVYHSGNLYDGNKNGVADGTAVTNASFTGSKLIVSQAFDISRTGAVDSAPVALQRVLDFGGPNWVNRNPIEERVVQSVRSGTGSLINDTTAGVQATEWATVLAQRPSGGVAPYQRDSGWDTDLDGMPGDWELNHGLNAAVANHNGDFDNDGYTDLEEYINEIAAWPAPAAIEFNGANTRYAEIGNWRVNGQTVNIAGTGNTVTYSNWQPSRFDTAVVNQGTVVVDSVGQHAGNLLLGRNAGDNATLNITSGWIKVEDAPHGLSDGITSIGDNPAATAALNLSGGKLTTKTLLKGAGGSFNFTGGVLSADTVGFDLVNNGGTIAPGASPGVTHVMGDLEMTSGVLEIEIGGTGVGEYDQLVVDGETTLGGTLRVVPYDLGGGAWAPELGDEFGLVASQAGFGGAFSSLELPGLGTGLKWSLTADEMFLSLAVVEDAAEELAGDYNDDGAVDAADYSVWRDSMESGTPLLNETASLGTVDYDDYMAWKGNFGATNLPGGGGSRNSVPEPATAWLVLLAALAIIGRKRMAW
jgi:hypothetical protein